MKEMSLDELFDRARLLTEPEGTHDRFRQNIWDIHDLLKPYLEKTGASELEKSLLVGHFGIVGETSNTISQLMVNIGDDLAENPRSDKALLRICLLSMLESHPSQYSHTTHSGENVIAALNRIINGIGKWTDENIDVIDPQDRMKILGHRHEFASALDEIYKFIESARPLFQSEGEKLPFFKRALPAQTPS